MTGSTPHIVCKELDARIRAGRIRDAKTLIGLLLWRPSRVKNRGELVSKAVKTK